MSTPALRDLESLTQVVRGASEPDLKVVLSRVALEVNGLLQAGSSTSNDYMTSVVAALRQLKGSAHADLRINCLMDAAQYFYVIGRAFSAIEPVVDAVDLATRAGHKGLHRKALTTLGIMYADTGNISRAIECYAEALDLVGILQDRDAECVVWINLGVALLYGAQYRDAISCFERVIHLATEKPSLHHYRTTALSNIALCSLHLEDFSRGLKAAETAIRESVEPHSATELVARVLREANYARLLLEVDSVERARERCELAQKYAARSKSARAEIAASIAQGLYEVHAGQVDVGISRLTSALEKARLLRPMLRDVLAALVKAYELIGEPQRALVYLREMMEALRRTQQENALQHVKLHLKQLSQELDGDVPIVAQLARHEAALKGKVAEQELFKSRIEMLTIQRENTLTGLANLQLCWLRSSAAMTIRAT